VGSELVVELTWRALGGAAFTVTNCTEYTAWEYLVWGSFIIFFTEIVSQFTFLQGSLITSTRIPPKGKHLDNLAALDIAFICFSKLTIPLLVFHIVQYSWHSGRVEWGLSKLSFVNTVVAFLLLFVIYDFFYSLFHRFLHHPSIYKIIHKHHHRQIVPTRGTTDAINVHPFEFVCGEYLHLLSVVILSYCIPVHFIAVGLFMMTGSVLACFNHTRYNIKIGPIYATEYHDLHHWFPDANFGQYIMLWDVVFGSFKQPNYCAKNVT